MTSIDLLDRVLDAAVLPGYTNVGYRLRRHAWSDAELERMDNRVALVTGATSGLGLATATGLARLGAGVRLLVRDAERGEQARARIVEHAGGADVEAMVCDLSDLGEIRRLAAAEPAHSTGGIWHDRRSRPTHRLPWTRESAAEREALWAACERLTSDHGDAT